MEHEARPINRNSEGKLFLNINKATAKNGYCEIALRNTPLRAPLIGQNHTRPISGINSPGILSRGYLGWFVAVFGHP